MKLGETCVLRSLKRQCEICEVADERDRLKSDLIDARNLYEANTKNAFEEIDRLKAELEEYKEAHAMWEQGCNEGARQRDLWKSKAEKLAKALDDMLGWQSLAPVTIPIASQRSTR